MAKKYTWQEVTNAPRGLFLVGDREFKDQDFTRKERAELLEHLSDGNIETFILAVLNARKTDPLHRDVDQDWLDANLNDTAVERLFPRLAALVGVSVNEQST